MNPNELDYTHVINNRRIVGGEKSELMAISPLKHKWAMESFLEMCSNDWRPQTVEMKNDIICYNDSKMMSEGEKFTYNKTLAFLSNLDGIQLHNLTENISTHITSPEVKMALTRQAFEESLHVLSYSYMIEAVTPNPMSIYMMFERDGMLSKKNESILTQSRILGESFSIPTFIKTIASNIALEGIYFYTGFLNMYNFTRNRKMVGSGEMISYINRDEDCHLRFFINMWHAMKEEYPEAFTPKLIEEVREIMYQSSELEKDWGRYIIQHGTEGMTDKMSDSYVNWLTDTRCESIDIKKVYNNTSENPCPWVNWFSSVNGNERNFFETKNISYQVGTLEW